MAAISLPEPIDLSENIIEYLASLKQMKKEIEAIVHDIIKAIKSGRMNCNECEGKGYVTRPVRDKDNPVILYEDIKCENCENGSLPLSKEVTDIVKLVFKPFQ